MKENSSASGWGGARRRQQNTLQLQTVTQTRGGVCTLTSGPCRPSGLSRPGRVLSFVFQTHTSSFVTGYTIQLSASGFDQTPVSRGPFAFKAHALSHLNLPPSLRLRTLLSSSLIPCIIDLTSLRRPGLPSLQTWRDRFQPFTGCT